MVLNRFNYCIMRKYIIFMFSLKSVTERTLLNQSRHFSLCTMAMEYACTDIKPHSNYNVNCKIFCVCVCFLRYQKKGNWTFSNADYSYLSVYAKLEYFYIHFWTGTYLKVLPTKNLLNISLLQNKKKKKVYKMPQQLGICCPTIRGKVSH